MDITVTRRRAARWAEHDTKVVAPSSRRGTGLPMAPRADAVVGGRRISWQQFNAITKTDDRPEGCPIPALAVVRPNLVRRTSTVTYLPRDVRFPTSMIHPEKRWRGWPVSVTTAPRYVAANDNRRPLRQVNDGPTDAWCRERDAAGFATETDLKATRIERALISDKDPAIVPLRGAMELLRAPQFTVANDNRAPDADDENANGGFGHERIHNQGSIKPSPGKVLRAMSDGLRPHVVTTKRKAGQEREILLRVTGRHTFEEGWHIIGAHGGKHLVGLIFSGGKMVAYGDRNRKCRAPWYDATRATEAKHDENSETAKHIAAQPEEDRAYARLDAANDNNAGVAWGYGRLAGVAEMKGVGAGKTSAVRSDVLQELDRIDTAATLDAKDVEIIEAVMADATFSQIGIDHGYAESSAHKMGRKLVLQAANNIQKKIAA